MARAALALLLVACLWATVVAVDRTRFKTCANSGFCLRNRDFAASQGVSPYEVVPGTLVQSSSRVSVELLHKENLVRFLLVMTHYKNDIVRVKITEKAPLHPRYQVGGVLLDSIEEEPFLGSSQDGVFFGKVQLIESPFELRFLSAGEEVLRANGRGLFNVEHYREKEAEKVAEIAEGEAAQAPEPSPFRQMGTQHLWEGEEKPLTMACCADSKGNDRALPISQRSQEEGARFHCNGLLLPPERERLWHSRARLHLCPQDYNRRRPLSPV
jgi:hypothetical protein